MLRRTCSLLAGAALLAIAAHAGEPLEVPPESPVGVASAYLDALAGSDLDAAEALFAASSSVFESGGSEGRWQDYRARHIGPELDQIVSFAVTRGAPESGAGDDGSMAFVAWPVEYRIESTDGRVIERGATVTFVLTREQGPLRIRHLHWSSRPK